MTHIYVYMIINKYNVYMHDAILSHDKEMGCTSVIQSCPGEFGTGGLYILPMRPILYELPCAKLRS